MTQKQDIYRKFLLKKVHTHTTYKQINQNDLWQDFLQTHFNVSSSKFLSINELTSLIDFFNHGTALCKDEKHRPNLSGASSAAQRAKIRELSLALGMDTSAMSMYIFRQTKVRTITGIELSNRQANAVIRGLLGIQSHKLNQ